MSLDLALTWGPGSRFWSSVDRAGGHRACWPFLGYLDRDGYGRFRVGRKKHGAHVVAFVLDGGELTAEKPCVLHRCDVAPCCNPSHLWSGTVAENNADMLRKGRYARGASHGSRTHPERQARGSVCRPKRPAHLHGELNGQARLTLEQVLRIRELLGREHQSVIAGRFGVSQSAVSAIATGKTWRCA